MSAEKWGNDALSPRLIGVCCAVGAAGLGLCYLAAAGAPLRYPVVNGASLALGLVAFAGLTKAPSAAGRTTGAIVLACGILLAATALFGVSADGATRWVNIGALGVQVSLVILPAMIVLYALRRDSLGTAGMVLAAGALALQPDRAMAGALAASLAALAMVRPSRLVAAVSLASIVAFGATLLRPDALPASPYVDQIFYSAFEVHVLTGVAVLAGATLLIIPAIAGLIREPQGREVYAVFGTVWLSIVIAAALGNYPTPLVGYGGSAVLGYLLSLAVLPRSARSAARLSSRAGGGRAPDSDGSVQRTLEPHRA